jgi:PBSX family phage terminase large subunit
LLDHLPRGALSEPPTAPVHASTLDTTALLARIRADLLPHQLAFVDDTTHRILGLCGGFGCGKTEALCSKAVALAIANQGYTLAVFEPTAVMLRDIWLKSFDDFLDRYDIPFSYRASPLPEYTLHLPDGDTLILCRSTETWNRIRGQNLAACLVDEIDTSARDMASKAVQMMLARLRSGHVRQLAMASTPEGFRLMHKLFMEDENQGERRLIKARTLDNPHLPDGFVDSMRELYPPQLLRAYLEGEFVNLASCSLYPDFDRSIHYTDTEPDQGDTIFIGVDINVGNSVTQHMVRRENEFHFFAEAVYRDTQQMAAGLKELYPWHFQRQQLVLIPDASAQQRSTAAAQESDVGILRKAGHTVKVQNSNPLVQDRINAVNVLIAQGRLRVGNGCKNLVRTLEQHAYDDKGRPEKGGVGMEDLSHAGDAMGYAVYRLAGIKPWITGGTRVEVW